MNSCIALLFRYIVRSNITGVLNWIAHPRSPRVFILSLARLFSILGKLSFQVGSTHTLCYAIISPPWIEYHISLQFIHLLFRGKLLVGTGTLLPSSQPLCYTKHNTTTTTIRIFITLPLINTSMYPVPAAVARRHTPTASIGLKSILLTTAVAEPTQTWHIREEGL